MPESVTDRPTKAHEYVFLLTKEPRYFFDQEAVREPHTTNGPVERITAGIAAHESQGDLVRTRPIGRIAGYAEGGRNVRSVWQIATQPYPEAHFATYPEELVRRCVLAGCPVRVCRVCGKPSERIVEPTDEYREKLGKGQTYRYAKDGPAGPGIATGQTANPSTTAAYQTVGWSDCGHNDWRPGVTLDPFIGSGTTCKVARDHGRHSIGIDLSADYLNLAARRLQQLSLLT